MIYARIVNHLVVESGPDQFAGYTDTFVDQLALEDYIAANAKWQPSPIYAKMVAGWPVALSDVDFFGRTRIFASLGEYEKYIQDNAALKPAVIPSQPDDADVWAKKLDDGWTDPVSGIKLRTDKGAKTMFAEMIVWIREGLDLGQLTEDMMTPIYDYYSKPHNLTIRQIRELMFRYGLAWKTMYDEVAP